MSKLVKPKQIDPSAINGYVLTTSGNTVMWAQSTDVTGFTYNTNNTLTINNTNGISYSVGINNFTGLTVNGSFSATTYLGLPQDVRVTGFTYNNAGLLTISQTSGRTYGVTITNFTGLTVSGSFSATTYLGLPVTPGVYVTGFTYNNAGLLTIIQNSGTTYSTTISNFTGLTVNGSFSATTYLGLPASGVFTGNTSANCITDLYISNLHACAPTGSITVFNNLQRQTSTASAIYTNVFGASSTASSKYASVLGGKSNTSAGATAYYATIVNGKSNTASNYASFIGNGYLNTVTADFSVIGGGKRNRNSGQHSFIGAGYANSTFAGKTIVVGGQANSATTAYSIVVGGKINSADGAQGNTYQVIVGGSNNRTWGVSNRSFIGGGQGNSIVNSYASVLGGKNGMVAGSYSSLLGGKDNTVGGGFSSVVGGSSNYITNNINFSSIVAGNNNRISGGTSHIAGGAGNKISATYGFIGGGTNNTIFGPSFSVIGGGNLNQTITSSYTAVINGLSNTSSGKYSTVINGYGNLASGTHATVVGGGSNSATTTYSVVISGLSNKVTFTRSTIVNGTFNLISQSYSSIVGGKRNKISDGFLGRSFIGGGESNVIFNDFATIGGGKMNVISTGGTYSSILGGTGNTIDATNTHVIGSSITAATANFTYLENLNIYRTPSIGITSDNVLVRASDGTIKTVAQASLSGGTTSAASAGEIYVTGFTYNNAGLLTIIQNSGTTYSATISNFTGLTVNGSFSATTYLGLPVTPGVYVTGFTYNNAGLLTITQNSGTTYSTTITNFTGLTVSGSFSATTYLGLPLDVRVTGFTYNNAGLLTITQTSGTPYNTTISNFTGLTVNGSFSATTYLGLPTVARYVTTSGFTGSVTQLITHSLNTNYVHCSVWDNVSGDLIIPQVVRASVNALNITVATTGTYDVLITG